MEVDNVSDTGQEKQNVPKNISATRDASNAFINPVGPQEQSRSTEPTTPLIFDKANVCQNVSQSLSIQSADLGNFARKRSRQDTPGTIASDQASALTGSPRTNRMQNLFPGGAETRTLKELVSKLLEVVKAGLPLANKSKQAQKTSIDVGTAADILVLTGAVYDQVMIEDARRNFTTPAALAGADPKSRPIIFKGKATDDTLAALTEQMAYLTSAVENLQPKQQPKKGLTVPSYALAASKHTPNATASQKSVPAKPQAQKMAPKVKPTNVISLVHLPGSEISHPGLSTAKLIQELNLALRAYNVKLNPEDETCIEVKSPKKSKSYSGHGSKASPSLRR
ncbi:uncharacterized protein MELLADRAFT_64401 [Melampsora larici-populina 98AG31]|uniref:Uncharacterized protein n=1 Tax=Melampsora larici-populina (strain 98AG31 / pathotype 3-4-7) TaxID=747676 RepID=F4RRA7_MELLP|nr:uncharacterized protein MELLADRAFT_64401 [Melampsora larici-populina 98AG31]EGG05182.1 hypothetical protein MELLADRAFT_64401 [Melampsora larici-populina 98AG31]